MESMKSKTLTINSAEVTIYSDGSIGKPNNKFKDKRVQRTFGSTRGTTGYMQVGINRKPYLVHRVIAEAFLPNFFDFPTVDHIDGDKSNNDISNLRMATIKDQCRAHRNKVGGCCSQYRGVTWSKRAGKWQSQCNVNGNNKYLGVFDDERKAAIARDTYAFSQGFLPEGLNFPELFQFNR